VNHDEQAAGAGPGQLAGATAPGDRLAGRVVLVMGAGSVAEGWSNGKASAAAYAREGALVACVDNVPARSQEVAHAISREGGRAIALTGDATSDADVEAVVARVVAEFGRLDVLHNNVGYGGVSGTPDQVSPQDWQREIDINLTSAYLGIRHCVPRMRAEGGGVITNISSLLAIRFLRSPNVPYTVAKAGVEALTRSCAAAYGRDNIRVNSIRIGFSETPLIRALLDASGLSEDRQEVEMAKSRAKVPLRGEHTDPFDVAAAAVFLACPAARHITGAIINVDGGLECAPI
jgi:NAD(P)-dependent dehydrogenase (short-subunit alcohol dehydrogenase family)